MQKYIDYLINWLQKELVYRNADGFIVGVSGGIDSAVVTYLLAKAYQKKTLGLILPCKSNPQDLHDAEQVLSDCQISYRTIDLTHVHNTFFTALGDEFFPVSSDRETKVIDGNARARLRMMTLYAVAQSKNYLVVGTDNAAEWLMGYFTKFGDGGVDIAPLIHLTKHDVREMATLLGVNPLIIDKAPSAGLWQDQTDEGEMGTSYDMITKYLLHQAIPEKDKEVIIYWHNRSHHKRALPRMPKPYRDQ